MFDVMGYSLEIMLKCMATNKKWGKISTIHSTTLYLYIWNSHKYKYLCS